MPEVSFPGDGHDGDQPPPASPARDETTGTPDNRRLDGPAHAPGDSHAGGDPDDGRLPGAPALPDDDWDPEAEEARFIADLEAKTWVGPQRRVRAAKAVAGGTEGASATFVTDPPTLPLAPHPAQPPPVKHA